MRKYLSASAGAASLIAGAFFSAQAGTYIPVPMVPGAVSEIVFGINDSNVVAGSFRDASNVEHGFFGPLDGSNWTTFDAPFGGTTGTEARGIANDGAITGIALNPNFKVGEEFHRAPDGTFSIFQEDGTPLDGVAQGLNSSDASVGDYIDADGKTVGYIGQSGSYVQDFKLHHVHSGKSTQISPRGIDDLAHNVVGFFVDQSGIRHGFWQNHTAKGAPYFTTVVDYRGAQATSLQDISEKGIISGQWQDSESNLHAFTLNLGERHNSITDLNPQDGSTYQQAWGINGHRLVAISTSIGQSYIYCPRKDPARCPTGGAGIGVHKADGPAIQ